MKTYSFMTVNNFRSDIKANDPVAAWNKIRKDKERFDFEDMGTGFKKIPAVYNGLFITYGPDGTAGIETWRSIFQVIEYRFINKRLTASR